ncbi:hypothetical protein TL16_g08114 [Triparma laevis f. inornata]|uniref:VLRF1 domain-containing protein n=1 Tax=Triparma laevis f. inornata TaxID=1714386 RepID=A0A9W7EJM5_9STRA|nr:hypothetical protein TL16_g08114 [Triparma laevis f. inornata]
MSSFAPSTAPPTPPTSLTIFDDTFATLLTEATSYYDEIIADSEKASNPYLEQSSSPLPRKSISQTPYYVLPTSSTKIVQFSPILFPPPTATLQTLPTALSTLKSKRVTIILLRSGSLSYGIYTNTKKTHHKSQKRYTVRKGQGGTQSSADSGKTIKSIGSQLRRDGEKKLREDCKQIPVEGNDVLVIGCSKVLRKGLLEDIGSPPSSSIYNITGVWEDSQKGVDSIWSRITSVVVREKVEDDGGWNVNNSEEEEEEEVNQSESESSSSSEEEKEKPKPIEIPYTALHLLCLEGGTPILPSSYLDFRAGPQLYTPLHAAASVNNVEAVRVLMEGGGSPILEDGRGRKVWDVCLGGGVKDFLRRFRGENGEKWDWAVTRIPEEVRRANHDSEERNDEFRYLH